MGMFQPPPNAQAPNKAPLASKETAESNYSVNKDANPSSRKPPSINTADGPLQGSSIDSDKDDTVVPKVDSFSSTPPKQLAEPPAPAPPNKSSADTHEKIPSTSTPRSKGASSLLSMFDEPMDSFWNQSSSPLPRVPEEADIHADDLQSTVRLGNTTTEQTSLLKSLFDEEKTPKAKKNINYFATNNNADESNSAFQALLAPKLSPTYHQSQAVTVQPPESTTITQKVKQFAKTHLQPTTFAGASMFLLYHIGKL